AARRHGWPHRRVRYSALRSRAIAKNRMTALPETFACTVLAGSSGEEYEFIPTWKAASSQKGRRVVVNPSPTRKAASLQKGRRVVMNRVIHFEFAAENPERAAKFYKTVFGWESTKWGGPQEYWLVKTGPDNTPGINGGILRQQNTMPKTVNTVEVSSIEEFIDKITRNGGSVAMPKNASPLVR